KNVIFRSFQKQRLIQIDQLLSFVIEKVDLGACDSEVVQHLEKFLAILRRAKVLAMLPEPDADALLSRIIHHFFSFLRCPLAPKSLDHVVLKSELCGHTSKLLHAGHAFRTSIQVAPHGAPRLYPRSAGSLGEELWVRRRTKVGKDAAIHKCVQ